MRSEEWIEGDMVVRWCRHCGGSGEVQGRYRDPLSGYHDLSDCPACDGGIEFVRFIKIRRTA